MPLVMTVRPPFTLPVMVPLTSSPLSSAFSRFIQAAERGLVARQDGVAVAVLERLDRDGDEVAGA